MHPRAVAVLAASLIAALAAVTAPTATAAVTASQVTSPADPAPLFYDLTNGQGPYGLRVTGTVSGSTVGNQVQLRCYGPAGPGDALISFTADAGTEPFDVFIDPRLLTQPCTLRAVPAFDGPRGPVDLSTYRGVRIYPSLLTDVRVGDLASPNSGVLYDIYDHATTPGRTTHVGIGSLGGCGIYFARPLDPNGDPGATGANVFNCAGWADFTADATPQSRSDIVIDGHNAFTAGVQQGSPLASIPGMPPLAARHVYDPASGALHVEESSNVVRCAQDMPSYPPANAAAVGACGSMVATGVAYQRTTQTSQDDRVITVTDRWTSTDRNEHSLDLLLEQDMSSNAYGLWVPWASNDFRNYPGTTSLGPSPTAPGSIYVRSDATKPDGYAAPLGAITFASAPDSVEFYDDGNPVSIYPQLHYVRTVPATGALVLTHSYEMGTSLPEVEALAAAAQTRLVGPALTITSPKDGAVIRSATATLRGTVSDNGRVAVTVGKRTLPIRKGRWVTTVKLKRGPNRVAVTATDDDGNQSQAAVTLDRHGRACVVPKVVGLTRHGASARLRRRGCRLGHATVRYVAPHRVKKGHHRITVRFRRGRIVLQRVRAGSKVDRGTRVRVTVQGSHRAKRLELG